MDNSIRVWSNLYLQPPLASDHLLIDCKTVGFFLKISDEIGKSVKGGIRVLCTWSVRVSLSVSSLVPDLLFDCSRILEYAKIQTVLQSNLLKTPKFSQSKTSDKRPSFIRDHDPSLAWRFYNCCKRPSDAWCGLFVHTPPGSILVSNQLPYATTNSLHFGWSLIRGSSVVMPSNMIHPKWIDSKF